MAVNKFANITARGTQAAFSNVMEGLPNVWQNHVTNVPSDAPDEKHVWMGMLPKPREFLGANEWDGILDFSFDVANKTYKMNFIIDEESMEDDRHGLVNRRVAEAAEAWGSFKDEQFKTLLEATSTSASVYDGTDFFADTRVIGTSANIDNNLADASPSDAENPTATEFLNAIKLNFDALWTFEDDQGRSGYNGGAMSSVRLIVPPKFQKAAVEAMNSTIISNTSNPYGMNLAVIDVLGSMTVANENFFVSAVGATRKGILYQERTPLRIIVINNPDDVAVNNGVLVLVRQRYRMTYGEPRRMTKMALT